MNQNQVSQENHKNCKDQVNIRCFGSFLIDLKTFESRRAEVIKNTIFSPVRGFIDKLRHKVLICDLYLYLHLSSREIDAKSFVGWSG